jgi:hypothetical protein
MKLRHSIFGIVVSLLFLFTPSLEAQDGLLGALSREMALPHGVTGFEQRVAAADFDNDQRPDGALLLPTGFSNGKRSFRIELHFTAGDDSVISFASAERSLSISTLDVNRDGAPDIVVEKASTRERLQVYLNDGQGAFHRAPLEDFDTPDPLAPRWQAHAELDSNSVYLTFTRSSETAGPQRAVSADLSDTGDSHLRPAALRVQSNARSRAASRAPPSAPAL